MTEIRKAAAADISTVAKLAAQLWPHHTPQEMEAEFSHVPENSNSALFLAFSGSTAVGFAQCSLRHDYVEGTFSSPVGYLEGIYTSDGCRGAGVARALLAECESWAKERGCSEFASDCELTNTQSLHFHLSVGFEEANRIICFTKKL